MAKLICKACSNKAVYKDYCKEHFISYFESNAVNTIKRFKLLCKKDRVAVAVSGGKDSMSLLHLLNKKGYNASALAIDEGIQGYRDKTLDTLEKYCEKHKVPLKILSFRETFGQTLDTMLSDGKRRPCTVCGVFRRYLLNQGSKDFDVIATGHNMDDEAQAIVMNLVKNNFTLLKRSGPVSGSAISDKFTRRVKPFYLSSEKEIMVYSYLNNLNTDFSECPNVSKSFRLRVRDMLNEYEADHPGTKRNVVEWFLKFKDRQRPRKETPTVCKVCGEASTKEVCNTCLLINSFLN